MDTDIAEQLGVLSKGRVWDLKRWEKGLQGEEKPKKGSQASAGRKEPRTREQAQRTQERQKEHLDRGGGREAAGRKGHRK